MKARKPDAPSYKESIQYYNGIKTEVSNERNTVAKVFVLIDNSEIQTLLKNFCMEWINSIIDVVNEMGKEELYRLHDIFDSTTR